ncbi:hypothetical protein WMB10_03930, partial [Tetragenococcus halophilus]|uniref:hypothetical protein n=1 Tax=Tetragenococcus halophilus TaxID=51669 RepID=UPI0030CA1267
LICGKSIIKQSEFFLYLLLKKSRRRLNSMQAQIWQWIILFFYVRNLSNDLLKDTLDEFLGKDYTLKEMVQKVIEVLDSASYTDKVNYMNLMKKLKSEPDFQSQIFFKALKILPDFPSSEDDPYDVLKGAFFGNVITAWSRIFENPTIDSLDQVKIQLIEFEKKFL